LFARPRREYTEKMARLRSPTPATRLLIPLSLTLGFLGLLAPFDSAQAVPVTWSFQGTVRDIESPSSLPAAITSLGVAVGAAVTGSVRIETDTPGDVPYFPGQEENGYPGAVQSAGVTIGDWALVQGSPGRVDVIGELDLGPGEDVESSMIDPVRAGVSASFSLALSQQSTLWLTGAMLATPPPLSELNPYALDSFPSSYWINGTEVRVDSSGAVIHVEMSSLVRVPEPATSALVLLEALVIASYRLVRNDARGARV